MVDGGGGSDWAALRATCSRPFGIEPIFVVSTIRLRSGAGCEAMMGREMQPILKASEVDWTMHSSFRWRDLRDAALGFEFWPLHWWPWFKLDRDDDGFGGATSITLGPLVVKLVYNAHDGPFGKPLP